MIDLRSDTVHRVRRGKEADVFLDALVNEGVLATSWSWGWIRLCTHLDVGDAEIDRTVEAASRLLVSGGGAR